MTLLFTACRRPSMPVEPEPIPASAFCIDTAVASDGLFSTDSPGLLALLNPNGLDDFARRCGSLSVSGLD